MDEKDCDRMTERYIKVPSLSVNTHSEKGVELRVNVFEAFDSFDGKSVLWNELPLPRLSVSQEEATSKKKEEFELVHQNLDGNSDQFTVVLAWWNDRETKKIVWITEKSASLKSFLMKSHGVSCAAIKKWAKKILLGLCKLHSKQIIHRDLRLDNIYYQSKSRSLKIGGFGMAKVVRKGHTPCSVKGCVHWRAPDYYKEGKAKGYDRKVDIWSFGMCVLEMATMEVPYQAEFGNNEQEVERAVKFGVLPHSLAKIKGPTDLLQFIRCCLRFQPVERYTAKKLFRHAFLKCNPDDTKKFIELRTAEEFEKLLENITVGNRDDNGMVEEAKRWDSYLDNMLGPFEAPVSKKLALSDGTVSPDQDVASAAATAALSGSTRVESEENNNNSNNDNNKANEGDVNNDTNGNSNATTTTGAATPNNDNHNNITNNINSPPQLLSPRTPHTPVKPIEYAHKFLPDDDDVIISLNDEDGRASSPKSGMLKAPLRYRPLTPQRKSVDDSDDVLLDDSLSTGLSEVDGDLARNIILRKLRSSTSGGTNTEEDHRENEVTASSRDKIENPLSTESPRIAPQGETDGDADGAMSQHVVSEEMPSPEPSSTSTIVEDTTSVNSVAGSSFDQEFPAEMTASSSNKDKYRSKQDKERDRYHKHKNKHVEGRDKYAEKKYDKEKDKDKKGKEVKDYKEKYKYKAKYKERYRDKYKYRDKDKDPDKKYKEYKEKEYRDRGEKDRDRVDRERDRDYKDKYYDKPSKDNKSRDYSDKYEKDKYIGGGDEKYEKHYKEDKDKYRDDKYKYRDYKEKYQEKYKTKREKYKDKVKDKEREREKEKREKYEKYHDREKTTGDYHAELVGSSGSGFRKYRDVEAPVDSLRDSNYLLRYPDVGYSELTGDNDPSSHSLTPSALGPGSLAGSKEKKKVDEERPQQEASGDSAEEEEEEEEEVMVGPAQQQKEQEQQIQLRHAYFGSSDNRTYKEEMNDPLKKYEPIILPSSYS